jgi:hypothetical protein|tara:strand:+ start:1066 stop:1662 length:597 start_codon:yes stop_codon:yes gene_type:complete
VSDGTLNFPKRNSAPDSPSADRYKIWVDGTDDEVKYTDDLGVTKTFKGDDGTQGIQGVQGVQGIQGVQGPTGPMSVEAFVTEKSLVTLPDSTTFQLIYNDSITISADGPCFLDISLAISPHTAGNDMRFEIDFDGVTLSPTYVEEHKDQSNSESMWRSQCIDLGTVVAGTYDLDLYFSKEGTGGTALLKNYTAKVVRY